MPGGARLSAEEKLLFLYFWGSEAVCANFAAFGVKLRRSVSLSHYA